MISAEVRARVLKLHEAGKGVRWIARSLELSRNTVRTILREKSVAPERKASSRPSLLDPYKRRVESLIEEDELLRKKSPRLKPLTARRIFKEIRRQGYTGGRTVLDQYVRKLRGRSRRARKPFRRFETAPAEESQQDWSMYHVPIGGRMTRIEVFSLVLCWSRFQFLRAYTDQKRSTLMWGIVAGLRYVGGVPWRMVFDRQKTITPVEIGGEPLINEEFEAFAKHYGFEIFLCEPGDKERKGKVERPFQYFETAFLPLRAFDSLEDFNCQLREWLDGLYEPDEGNHRRHHTTGEVPAQRWIEEQRYLFALPPTDHLPRRLEKRSVYRDCTVSVGNCRYTVPASLVERGVRDVWVSIGDGDLKIYDPKGDLVAEHKTAEGGARLVIDEAHYREIGRRSRARSRSELERDFLERFPAAGPFLEELQRTVRSITPIHLREIRALAGRYRRQEVEAALARAVADGTTTSGYVRSILERRHPTGHLAQTRTEPPKGLRLGAVDPGSPEGYAHIFPEDLRKEGNHDRDRDTESR